MIRKVRKEVWIGPVGLKAPAGAKNRKKTLILKNHKYGGGDICTKPGRTLKKILGDTNINDERAQMKFNIIYLQLNSLFW